MRPGFPRPWRCCKSGPGLPGTCCRGRAKRDDCPVETFGYRCMKDRTTCVECTWRGKRGCFCLAIDRNMLKM